MLILNPNPCLDITMWVNQLVHGSVHRAIKNETTAGGKGINVARACQTMGVNPHLLLMLPVQEGGFYRELLDSEGHDVEYLEVDGEVRKALIMNEESSPAITIFNGQGPAITEKKWDEYCITAATRTQPDEIVLMMGSLPISHPDNAIDQLAEAISKVGGKLLVDTSPSAFKSCKNEMLDIISPNLEEAEAMISNNSGNLFEPNDVNVSERALAAAEALFNKIGKNIIVTAGAHGCAFKNVDEHWWLPAFVIPPDCYRSAVGAGDSFVAGLAIYYETHGSESTWRDRISFGMATAAASCETYRAGGFEKARVLEILSGGRNE
jgi:1-phosphofructokinase family hexose kinase